MSLEVELVNWLKENLSTDEHCMVGLGDDAAVLNPSHSAIVVTTDMLTDGVDFQLDRVDPRLIGHKALGVNLSDLAAMAAEPMTVFVSLVLPRETTGCCSPLELAKEIYRGMLPLAKSYGVSIAGGDTNSWEGSLVISITALGKISPRGALTRAGAKTGDQLLVTGNLGGSILGRHLQVQPRIREALLLHQQYDIHAAIDISDGLALDAHRLAEASECGVELVLENVPISADAHRLSEVSGKSALDHALGDGEDFELLLAVPPNEAERLLATEPLAVPLTRIGEFVHSRGLWKVESNGTRTVLTPTGYQHEAMK